MPVPPPIPSWDQHAAVELLAACERALELVGALEAEQRGLDRLAADQWRGASRRRFDTLIARREGALEDLYAALWQARAEVESALAAAPAAILRAQLQAVPFAPTL
jgi:hypothetical protein